MKIIALKLILTTIIICSSAQARSVADVIHELGGDISQVASGGGIHLSGYGIDSLVGLSSLMRMVPNATVIDLSYNKITSLNEGDFDGCEQVLGLHLFGQNIGSVSVICGPNWSRGLLSLRTVNLEIPPKAEKLFGGSDLLPRKTKF